MLIYLLGESAEELHTVEIHDPPCRRAPKMAVALNRTSVFATVRFYRPALQQSFMILESKVRTPQLKALTLNTDAVKSACETICEVRCNRPLGALQRVQTLDDSPGKFRIAIRTRIMPEN